MRAEAGELFCLTMPEFFVAVGLHYRDFNPPTDKGVEHMLRAWQARAVVAAPA